MLKKISKDTTIIIITLLVTCGLFNFLIYCVKKILLILFVLQMLGLIYIYG